MFQPGADAAACRPTRAADHAAAFCVSENFRRLRSAVHVLRDSQRCAANTPPSRWKKSSPRPSELAADGVRELIIVAQDTTYYGIDLYGEPRLAELLRELEQVEGHRLDSADVPVSRCTSATS